MCMLSCFSCVQLFAILWTIAPRAPLSMGFSRQESWSGWPCPPPGDLTDLGIKPASLRHPALVGMFFTTSTTWEAPLFIILIANNVINIIIILIILINIKLYSLSAQKKKKETITQIT